MLSLQRILSRTKKYRAGCVSNTKITSYMPGTLDLPPTRSYNKFVPDKILVDEEDREKYYVEPELRQLSKKIIHSDYLEKKTLLYDRLTNAKILTQLTNKARAIRQRDELQKKPESLALKYFIESKGNPRGSNAQRKLVKEEAEEEELEIDENGEHDASDKIQRPIHMPYASTDSFEKVETVQAKKHEELPELNQEYVELYEKYLESHGDGKSNRDETIFKTKPSAHSKYRPKENFASVPPDWMTSYEQYNDFEESDPEKQYYGTPDKHIPVSSVPCGGCGALLHCQDAALPGYLPSELFVNQENSILRNSLCQRCHFMKFYKTTLDVTVPTNEYGELFRQIKFDKAAIILMVDLTDFPCSIWPGITQIIEKKTHVFLVGNKVDLLPNDGPGFLKNVETSLVKAVVAMGINKANIKSVTLLSAQTGYGVESLINRLHKLWEYRGDVYLVGCTNVGKSSLFNTLLRSDYCKVQASDVIRRATISPWPGTTLNVLKFPILNPVRWRLWMRTQRLMAEREGIDDVAKFRQDQFKETKKIKYSSLHGHVGKTFTARLRAESDGYVAQVTPDAMEETGRFGLDENNKIYERSRWCYDTPGAILPDQILHLLTLPELVKTLPRGIISPKSYILYEEQSLFLAGLGRLDLTAGCPYITCTVFAAHDLPVTICQTVDADTLYKTLLETEILVVPSNDPERLKLFPPLQSKSFEITGIGTNQSAADVVLSSAGWVAVTLSESTTANVEAWTPEGRGIHLRTPAMLSRSVSLKGYRVPSTQKYTRGKRVYVKN